ncbi:MAG TPA: PadR family transcriptional regulator [Acidobacteriota bacterium]|nr:PadR family transcriptional regulator [Acidobacteriota bacterium]
MPLTHLAYHVLLALAGGAGHGYAIGKEVEERSAGRLSPATGSLYQVLKRLREDGLIEEAPDAAPSGGDSRRQYFRLTPLGTAVAEAETARLRELLLAARERNLVSGDL